METWIDLNYREQGHLEKDYSKYVSNYMEKIFT